MAACSPLSAAEELRTDPTYLEPFLGETWAFEWPALEGGQNKTSITITFDNTLTTSPTTEWVSLSATDDAHERWKMYYDENEYTIFHY